MSTAASLAGPISTEVKVMQRTPASRPPTPLEQLRDILRRAVERTDRGSSCAILDWVRDIRLWLTTTRPPPIDDCIRTNVVPLMIQLLDSHYDLFPIAQIEAAWILCNIAGGTDNQTAAVIRAGAIPPLYRLARRCDVKVSPGIMVPSPPRCIGVRLQCVWTLGNIVGGDVKARDQLVHRGWLRELIHLCSEPLNLPERRTAIWALSNSCRRPFRNLRPWLPTLRFLCTMMTHSDAHIVEDSLCGAQHLTEDATPRQLTRLIRSTPLVRTVVRIVRDNTTVDHHRSLGLLILGALALGTPADVSALIQRGVLDAVAVCVSAVLRSGSGSAGTAIASSNPGPHSNARSTISPILQKRAFWVLSNLCCDSNAIDAAILVGCLPRPLIRVFGGLPPDILTDAMWVLSNTVDAGADRQRRFLVDSGIIRVLMRGLDRDCPSAHGPSLAALVTLIQRFPRTDIRRRVMMRQVYNANGVDRLTHILRHSEDDSDLHTLAHLALDLLANS